MSVRRRVLASLDHAPVHEAAELLSQIQLEIASWPMGCVVEHGTVSAPNGKLQARPVDSGGKR